MSPLDILERCRHAGIILTADGDHLAYDAPTGALTGDLLEAMRANKADLLTIIGTDRRVEGRELAHPGEAGWACPRCGEAAQVFYGFAPDVSCRRCSSARTRGGASRRPSKVKALGTPACPGCGAGGSSPPACPGCGAVTAHPPSLDHETGPAWWCANCTQAQVSSARAATAAVPRARPPSTSSISSTSPAVHAVPASPSTGTNRTRGGAA